METTLDFYKDGKHGEFVSYAICIKLKWPYNDNYVTITFSDLIMPYLFELKKCFTQYPIGILQNLKSKNSWRIKRQESLLFFYLPRIVENRRQISRRSQIILK